MNANQVIREALKTFIKIKRVELWRELEYWYDDYTNGEVERHNGYVKCDSKSKSLKLNREIYTAKQSLEQVRNLIKEEERA